MTVVDRYLEAARQVDDDLCDQTPTDRLGTALAHIGDLQDASDAEFRVCFVKRILPSLCLTLVSLERQ
jgi:hypothetical protein